MANAKKCDRCGKYYDSYDMPRYKLLGRPENRSLEELDLCEECMAELVEWFKSNDGIIMRKAYELMAIEMSRTSGNTAESLRWHYLLEAKEVIENEAD